MSKNLIKTGDIFRLGSHLLACGDATDAEFVTKLKLLYIQNFSTLETNNITLCLTDPPYGVNYVANKKSFQPRNIQHKAIINDHQQSEREYSNFTEKWLQAIKPHLALKNSIYIFNSDKMLFALREGMQKAKYYFSQLLIWVKTQAVLGRLDYLPQHELISYGWFGKHEFRKAKDKSILIYPKPKQSKLHPTMKPVGLLRKLILNSSKLNDLIYDPFGGSGSTLIACEQVKRRCLMLELDPAYCQIIIKRWEKLTKLKTKKLHSLESIEKNSI
uniref:Methyltransferase n=1 Tax=Candidatus Kentrum sp. LPFa TaxID=2126335 RepID=A0A450XN51_9GAMM|nr:MAG: DNA modification methylase [Candidatus Kentron sp. LPFa]